MKTNPDTILRDKIAACTLCAPFLQAGPRPVVRFSASARLLIIGQAPGIKVHESGTPWNDASGERLREWLGLTHEVFYDPARVALVPMGFCYPGKGKSGDLPPRKECAPAWHPLVLSRLPQQRLTLLVGSYAQAHYLPGDKRSMTEKVQDCASFLPHFLPLPHPSWRSTGWMRDNPRFETDVLPLLRREVRRHVAPA